MRSLRPSKPVLALLVLVLGALGGSASAGQVAGPNDYCGRQLGQWFYCARPPAPPAPAPEAPSPTPATPAAPPEVAELEAFQREIDNARKVAVWSPTPANIEKYYRLQQIALNKGGLFADEWRRMIWANPDLDYTLDHPITEIGKRDWEDSRTADRDLFLRGVSGDVGLFYVFRGSCSACRTASPLVQSFADRYGVIVKAISTDGTGDSTFPSAVPDRGQLAAWGVDKSTTPALLVFQNPNRLDRQGQSIPTIVPGSNGNSITLRPCLQPSGCLTYLGAGIMPVEDIAERLFVTLAFEPGTDF